MLLVLCLALLGSVSSFAVPSAARPSAATACAAAPTRASLLIAKEKKDVLELEGVVLEALPGANFRVQLDDTEQVILAHVSGKIRKNFIKILVGDHVTCEISPYDLVCVHCSRHPPVSHLRGLTIVLCRAPRQTKGRITFRRR